MEWVDKQHLYAGVAKVHGAEDAPLRLVMPRLHLLRTNDIAAARRYQVGRGWGGSGDSGSKSGNDRMKEAAQGAT